VGRAGARAGADRPARDRRAAPVTNAAEPPYVSFQSYRFTNGDFVLSGAPAYTRFFATPEPTTLALAEVGGLAGLGVVRRRRTAA
jgi:hypothetical protein